MASGFNSPSILCLSTWDEPERNYMFPVLERLRARGYTRYVEPCVTAFAMPSIAVEAGWKKSQILTADVWLFSAVLGALFNGTPFSDLGITLDGLPVPLDPTLPPAKQAAALLYTQLRARMDATPEELPYFVALRHDLDARKDQHVADIEKYLAKLDERLHGITHHRRDVWSVIEEFGDDPHTVIACNSPTYKGAYEKFFGTNGRLTWAEPVYDVWDADVDIFKLVDAMQGKQALLLAQQQQDPGRSAKGPVYARHLSAGQYVYICTNRPTEVLDVAGGMKVRPLRGQELAKLNLPILPPDYQITKDTKVRVMAVGGGEATYYRDLWLHKLDYRSAGYYVAVVLDNYIAGMIGYDAGPIYRPYTGAADDVRGALLLTFAVGAPHQRRLTRLITMVALLDETLRQVLKPDLHVLVDRLITVELTKHPEAKGLRGLMKLQNRRTDPKYGYRLVYGVGVDRKGTLANAPGLWRKKEDAWDQERARLEQAKAHGSSATTASCS
jgi:hypothetical protein